MDDGSMILLLTLVCDKQRLFQTPPRRKPCERIGIQQCSANQLHCVDMNPSLFDCQVAAEFGRKAKLAKFGQKAKCRLTISGPVARPVVYV